MANILLSANRRRDGVVISVSPMDTRIKEFRKRAGLTQSQLAEMVDLSTPYVSQIERGADGKRVSTTVLARIAEALGVAVTDLLAEARTVPVIAYVGAGSEVYPIDDHEKGDGIDSVPAPPGAGPSAVAVIVRGDSMWPKYEEGDILIYDDRQPPSDLIGKICVAELEDGRVLVKKIKRGAGDSFTLVSHNAPDIEDVYVRWAARVAFVIPA